MPSFVSRSMPVTRPTEDIVMPRALIPSPSGEGSTIRRMAPMAAR